MKNIKIPLVRFSLSGLVAWAVVCGALALSSARAGITDGLIGHFPFDENTIETEDLKVLNTAGGPGAIIQATPESGGAFSAFPKGRIAGAADFKPAAFVQAADPAFGNFGEQSFSVSGWFHARTAPTGESPVRVLIGKGRTNQATPGWVVILRFDARTGDVQLSFGGTDESGRIFSRNVAVQGFDLDQWFHFAVVLNREENLLVFYLNGVQAESDLVNGLGSVDSPDALGIGGLNGGGGRYNGLLDDTGVWSRALSGAEIAGIYSRGLRGISLEKP